ncbi:hypothetical protein [Clostridium oryzae]|uniref:Uncharacterized protein n=1 Tax=Clostridium oryzae TaxID=1450648 RepID=A0A1V4ICV5_9CLOT|nr:hypothetical protein [Clostridium oryzae]OPJ57832.1 hypothetical protein CLORY_39030 [Clostridium oryzae]
METMINAIGFSYRNRRIHGSSVTKTAMSAIRAISASIFRKSVDCSVKPEFYSLT